MNFGLIGIVALLFIVGLGVGVIAGRRIFSVVRVKSSREE